jgi:hypothetical protein|tara:strand:+ start:1186 stop:1404 length:219 start_codon:yes stop_codon:yes gene_type:complete
MSKKQKEQTDQTVTIDDKEYNVSDLSQEQIAMINHINDLDRKISSSQFNLEQLQFGKSAFTNSLAKSLKTQE